MIVLSQHMRILICIDPVDFRRGLDSLIGYCRDSLMEDPFSGSLYLFRNRSGTAIKMITFDGGGNWLILKRFSEGKLKWWPKSNGEKLTKIAARELQVLLHNGNPEYAQFAEDWRSIK